MCRSVGVMWLMDKLTWGNPSINVQGNNPPMARPARRIVAEICTFDRFGSKLSRNVATRKRLRSEGIDKRHEVAEFFGVINKDHHLVKHSDICPLKSPLSIDRSLAKLDVKVCGGNFPVLGRR